MTEPESPDALLAAIALAAAEATTLPPAAYTDPALLALERSEIFAQDWVCVARSDELPEPGSQLGCKVNGVPVLVVRQPGGMLGAFANVCLHRASVLVDGACRARAIRCPYHAWSYDLDGRLINSPRMPDTFSTDGRQLARFSVCEWRGFLFVSLAPSPAPLAEKLGGLDKAVAPYRPEAMRTLRREQYRWRCNWKVLVENGLEAYHLHATHSRTLAPLAPAGLTIMEDGPLDYFHYRAGLAGGAETAPFDPMLKPLVPQPDRTIARETVVGGVFPSLVFSISGDWIWWIAMQPDGVDHVIIEHGLSAPFDLSPEEIDPAHPGLYFLDLAEAFNEEDRLRTEAVQHGAESGLGRTAPLSPLEIGTQRFAGYLARTLSAGHHPSDGADAWRSGWDSNPR
ncbi:MAG TPA: aromatic ring-hydroxylating dioxygenase subunit alpha [Sphingopyxis sp.]|nr:aromatic ring-hydroxylating dioxygenase subunit alpha [Sphingopyxis sp.]HMP44529.1 aromatic ring-hydroxylating dioxygenase subunit alpha [Sphingopyxis sp.]